jgi:hypothetical protein
MSIEIDKCIVFPVSWIPDVYINPSNNGNLQSSKYKNLENAVKRNNVDFFEIFKVELENANKKRYEKNRPKKRGPKKE